MEQNKIKDEELFNELGADNKVEVEEVTEQQTGSGSREFSLGDLEGTEFIKNPNVGESIVLTVKKVENITDPTKLEGTNKETNEKFPIGVKRKDGTIVRWDLHCEEGLYTIKSWEILYKITGKDKGVLKQAYDKKLITAEPTTGKLVYNNVKIKITRHFNGNYAMKPVDEVMKLMDKTEEEAKAYKTEVGKALKESRIFTVELVE